MFKVILMGNFNADIAVSALKEPLKVRRPLRVKMVEAREILGLDKETAGFVESELAAAGIECEIVEVEEPVVDPIDEKAERVVAIVTRLLTLEATSPEARMTAWLNVAEAEEDPVVLAWVAVKVAEAGVDAVLGQVLADRIAVLNRAPEKAPGGPVVVGEWTKPLQCPLSDTEIAQVMREVSPLRKALVERLEKLTKQVKATKDDINTCLRRYDMAGGGMEERQVKGRSVLVGEEVHEIRDDTGEVIERRPPTNSERQVLLFPSTPTLDNPPQFDPDCD